MSEASVVSKCETKPSKHSLAAAHLARVRLPVESSALTCPRRKQTAYLPAVRHQHGDSSLLAPPWCNTSARERLQPSEATRTDSIAGETKALGKQMNVETPPGINPKPSEGEDRASRNGGASTSGRDDRETRRPPVTWRRRRTGEPLGWRAGLPKEVVETMALLRRERDPETVKALLIRLEGVSRGLVVNTLDEFERRGEARCCITVRILALRLLESLFVELWRWRWPPFPAHFECGRHSRNLSYTSCGD